MVYQCAALLVDAADPNLKAFGLLFKWFIMIILSNEVKIAFEWTR